MKVLLAVATNVVPPLDVVASQRDSAMASLQSFTALKRESKDKPLAWRLHLDRLTLAIEAEIRWLDTVENRILAEANHGQEGQEPHE